MAEALLCIVAQRLVKKLCNHCRSIVPTPEKEKQILQAFMPEPPETVAQPKGCPYCKNTGYHGREGVYEVMTISPDLAELIRSGTDINHIRIYYKQHGGYLMADHALSKILNYTFSVNDAYEKVLVEELSLSETPKITPTEKQPFASTQTPSAPQQPTILLVDDDPEIIQLLTTILSNRNYQISSAKDGIDALMLLSNKKFDLIISDVNMPNLDGFKLIEIMNQKNIKCPLLFLTSRTSPEDELKGLELGAIDYNKKPIQKDVFLARLSKLLKK
jgi:CheY-like chemotaxis protein